ncbi:MAG TPA: hypothetical protein VGS19_38060 [Streptosporangiaceae bacterium]|nr:hypothetical protein [Streptosporangiaceae bacterium]
MSDDELHQQLTCAAGEFPVRGWPSDLQQRVTRRRRTTAGSALAVGAVAIAAVAVVVPEVTGPGPLPGGTVIPASSTGAGYVGSNWRLTSVAEGTRTTTIPADAGAYVYLVRDGVIAANDGVNFMSGRFTKSADGFKVHGDIMSLAGYLGRDPHVLAAIGAIDTLMLGNGQSGQDTVVSANRTRLVVQAGAYRLTFERTGPAPNWP